MKVKDIKYFLQEIQLKTLKELEKRRRTALYAQTAVTTGAVVFLLCFILFVLGIILYGQEEFFKKLAPFYEPAVKKIYSFFNTLSTATSIPADWMAWICLTAVVILTFLFYSWIQNRYIDVFKEKINKKLFTRLHPQIKYNPDGYISKENFKHSCLFADKSYTYEGCDHCSLRVKNHLIEFSEVKASVHESTGRYSSTETVYFHGLFMKLDLKTSSGFIGIIPKQKDKGFFSILEDRTVHSFKGKQKLNLPEDFGQKFDVYCDDIPKTQKILTSGLKSHILHIHSQFDKNIYISLQDSLVYMAVECGEFFEPPLKKNIQIEDLKKTALLLNAFVDSISSMIPLLHKSSA